MRVALIVFAALGAILLFLLASASANTALFADTYPLLLGINGVAAVALLGLVLAQLVRLRRDAKAGVFGSRLKTRLLGLMALMAILPGALVYAVSMQFAVKSIDSWFDVRVDAALEGGIDLGRSVLETLQTDLLDKTRSMADELGSNPSTHATRLNRLREQAAIASAVVLNPAGQTLASSSGEIGDVLPPLPTPAQLRSARGGRGFVSVIETDTGLQLRALAPLRGNGFELEPNVLQLIQPVPPSIARSAENVQIAHRNYQELQLASAGLKRIYTLTLTLTLLLALFAAVALAFLLAERLARPLLILAEGTQAVAAGDFTPRATVAGNDELGVLTHSFNSMTQQLGEARGEAERHRSELEAAQAYLESVLANLSAGVLAFDAKFRLRAANSGAMTILDDTLTGYEKLRLPDWPRHEGLAGAVLEGFAKRGNEWQEQIEIPRGNGGTQMLLVRGKALPKSPSGDGYVVVFDDITQLIAAQRSEAWGEVARRLAHEIKNPLTPIQLSAERLQMKLADKLEGSARELLDRSTHTIVSQVEAMKNMVNDFRDYARTPPPQIVEVDLPALLEDVLHLYENAKARIAVTSTGHLRPDGLPVTSTGHLRPDGLPVPPAPTFATVLADPNQLRQILHNLLTNAQDALIDTESPRITLSLQDEGARLKLSLRDNGPGFPPDILARAFEPYVTTKTKGTGLGLAIVKKIVDDHGGEISLGNAAEGGGEIQLWLPLAAAPANTQEGVV
jgi:nitrogen fixation/metabolism regulation signal transduction histidine kinase